MNKISLNYILDDQGSRRLVSMGFGNLSTVRFEDRGGKIVPESDISPFVMDDIHAMGFRPSEIYTQRAGVYILIKDYIDNRDSCIANYVTYEKSFDISKTR